MIKILNSLFKGDEEFDDPYFATWFLIDDKLINSLLLLQKEVVMEEKFHQFFF